MPRRRLGRAVHMLFIMGMLLESMKLGFNFIKFLSMTLAKAYHMLLYIGQMLVISAAGRQGKRVTSSVKEYLQSEYPDMDITHFFALFSWMIPSKQLPSLKDIDFDSDMKEMTTSSGIELQSLLSDSLIGAITCKTVAVSFAATLSVQTMMGRTTFDVRQK
ncbi:hypothetical protein KY290_037004 [Solanum tuberosum]|uniref:DUF7081 domain-containing protein n=1 Tax=Solanum tuberosum TaxID=4113 RepID=A0ABQ7TVM4_SOLTU|nr:hypothetical protein KY290_037004 [Solanum tuberosum]